MEELDIVDRDGNKTGDVRSATDVHMTGLLHKTVHVWIVNSKNEILLQLRSLKKAAYPGFWDVSAAGHVHTGERNIEAAMREVNEELGLNIKEAEFLFLGTVQTNELLNDGTYMNNEVNDVYVVHSDVKIEDISFKDHEVESVLFVPRAQLEQRVKEGKEDLVPRPDMYKLLFANI